MAGWAGGWVGCEESREEPGKKEGRRGKGGGDVGDGRRERGRKAGGAGPVGLRLSRRRTRAGSSGGSSPPSGQDEAPPGADKPCERHINQLSPMERLTRAPLSLTKVTSHIYNVPVKPISCESVVGAAFYWILVNSELVK